MTVTAINQPLQHTGEENSRSAAMADLSAQFRAWESQRERWEMMIAAKNKIDSFPRYFYEAKQGKCCGHCGKTFDNGEPVNLCRLSILYSGHDRDWHYQKYTLCGNCCIDDKHQYLRIIYTCRACGREVNGDSYDFRHSTPHCSDKCYWTLINRRKRSDILLLRKPIYCEVCSTEFTPSRTDSRYCSSKCRQKAYRQRKNESAT